MAQTGLWIVAAGVAAAAAAYSIGTTRQSESPADAVQSSTAPSRGSAPASHPRDPGTLARYDLASGPAWTVPLPAALAEVSGLAFTPDGRLFAHGDEEATVWELDPRRGTVRKTFALSKRSTSPRAGTRRLPLRPLQMRIARRRDRRSSARLSASRGW